MPMTPDERKKALRAKGLTYKQVGQLVEPKPVSEQTIYANVHELPGAKSGPARRAIAAAIGLPLEQVFAVDPAQPGAAA